MTEIPSYRADRDEDKGSLSPLRPHASRLDCATLQTGLIEGRAVSWVHLVTSEAAWLISSVNFARHLALAASESHSADFMQSGHRKQTIRISSRMTRCEEYSLQKSRAPSKCNSPTSRSVDNRKRGTKPTSSYEERIFASGHCWSRV